MEKKLPLILLIILISLFKASSVQAQTSCPTVPTNTGTVVLSTTTTAGTYRVWSRMKAADANNNSFYLKIDNNCAILVGNSSQVSSTSLTWVDYQNGSTSTKIDATLTAGAHIITLIGNKPGVSVDKIILTKNLSCTPTGFGTNCPAELSTSSPTPTPTLSPTNTPMPTPTSTPTVCTADAKLCPDGSYVQRISPTCQFAQCPYTTPTPTIAPTVAPTLTPTPSPRPADTLLTLGIGLDGIWNSGTHSNTNGSSSTRNPRHTSRTFAIDIIDKNNNPVVQGKSGTLSYDSAKGYFAGTINLGDNFASGSYLVKVKTEGYLKRLLPGIQNISYSLTQPIQLPRVNLVAGDIDSNNALTISDYNILLSCVNGPDVKTLSDSTELCGVKYQALSDLDDNGVVNQIDLNLFLEEYSAQNGD